MHGGQAHLDGASIDHNAGESTAFFSLCLPVSRSLSLGGRARLEALAEVFNLIGTYPPSPSSTFGQVMAVGDPRSWQFDARMKF